MMSNREKMQVLLDLQQQEMGLESKYYEALERIGDLKYNYPDFMISVPIDCDTELLRLPSADYDLACALLTMLLREDHFCNGSFSERYRAGDVQPIVQRMIDLLSAERR